MADSGETPAGRRPARTEDHMTSRDTQVGSGAPPGGGSGITEQAVTSLKVTIQQSSENRAFGQTGRQADRQPAGLLCHVCDVTCGSLKLFQEHMTTAEHVKNMREMSQSVSLRAHQLSSRRWRSRVQRWCDTCQTHFSSDVISHRQSRQHKEWKKRARPFCPACQRPFKTPRKFVEHMKSVQHKQQVHLQEQQEEELITLDAVGCFEEEKELPGEGGGGKVPKAADEQNTRVDPLLPPEQGGSSREVEEG